MLTLNKAKVAVPVSGPRSQNNQTRIVNKANKLSGMLMVYQFLNIRGAPRTQARPHRHVFGPSRFREAQCRIFDVRKLRQVKRHIDPVLLRLKHPIYYIVSTHRERQRSAC